MFRSSPVRSWPTADRPFAPAHASQSAICAPSAALPLWQTRDRRCCRTRAAGKRPPAPARAHDGDSSTSRRNRANEKANGWLRPVRPSAASPFRPIAEPSARASAATAVWPAAASFPSADTGRRRRIPSCASRWHPTARPSCRQTANRSPRVTLLSDRSRTELACSPIVCGGEFARPFPPPFSSPCPPPAGSPQNRPPPAYAALHSLSWRLPPFAPSHVDLTRFLRVAQEHRLRSKCSPVRGRSWLPPRGRPGRSPVAVSLVPDVPLLHHGCQETAT